MSGPIYRKRRSDVVREGRVALKFAATTINSSLVSDTSDRTDIATQLFLISSWGI